MVAVEVRPRRWRFCRIRPRSTSKLIRYYPSHN